MDGNGLKWKMGKMRRLTTPLRGHCAATLGTQKLFASKALSWNWPGAPDTLIRSITSAGEVRRPGRTFRTYQIRGSEGERFARRCGG